MRTKGVMESKMEGMRVSSVRRRMMVTEVESPRTERPGIWTTGACWAAARAGRASSAGMLIDMATRRHAAVIEGNRINVGPLKRTQALHRPFLPGRRKNRCGQGERWIARWRRSANAGGQIARRQGNASLLEAAFRTCAANARRGGRVHSEKKRGAWRPRGQAA